jgi:hypothetical protein
MTSPRANRPPARQYESCSLGRTRGTISFRHSGVTDGQVGRSVSRSSETDSGRGRRGPSETGYELRRGRRRRLSDTSDVNTVSITRRVLLYTAIRGVAPGWPRMGGPGRCYGDGDELATHANGTTGSRSISTAAGGPRGQVSRDMAPGCVRCSAVEAAISPRSASKALTTMTAATLVEQEGSTAQKRRQQQRFQTDREDAVDGTGGCTCARTRGGTTRREHGGGV